MILMPCPFAPLLTLLPSLPFIPWLLGKFFKSKAAKFKQMQVNNNLNVPFEAQDLQSFEYYESKAPHFRKQQAISSGITENAKAEYLIFDQNTNQNKAKQLSELLSNYDLTNAIVANHELKLKFKKNDCSAMNPNSCSKPEKLLEEFNSELIKLQA